MRIVKIGLGILVAAGIVAALVYASLPQPVDVELAAVQRGPLVARVEADGRTRVEDRYVIMAPLHGNLARIELDPGDDVQAGDVVARISPSAAPLLDPRTRAELAARVSAARAARRQSIAAAARAEEASAFASRELARIEALASRGALPDQQLDAAQMEARHAERALESARFGAQVAKHELDMAEAALGRLSDRKGDKEGDPATFEIRAPAPGRVLRVLRESEGVVNPGTPLVEIGDSTRLEIVADVLTQDAVKIPPSAPVHIERWGGDQPLLGKVRRVEPSAFTKVSALGVEEQRVDVVIELAGEQTVPERLGDGYAVDVGVVVWKSDDALYLPAGALHRRGEDWAVYVTQDGRVVERVVEIGHRSGIDVQIVSGLEAGEKVIVHPSDQVQPGVEVRAVP